MRRNFVIASILHVTIIFCVVLWENFLGGFSRPAMASVSLYTPADILGDMPKGDGYGRGNYKAPGPVSTKSATGPSDQLLPADESKVSDSKTDEVLIPKKTAAKKPVKQTKKTAPKKTTTAKKSSATGNSQVASAEDIKNRFAKALQSTDDGTPYGDGKKAGGGSGQGRIGSPNGAVDGVVGGVGQGSPNWRYYEHVHDAMYEAWEQPGSAMDRKLIVTVLLRIARDGTINDVSLRIPSGDKSMDDSALAAARRVQRLDPPPDNLVRGNVANITVDFQVEG